MNLKLEFLPGQYAISRLAPGDAVPAWATGDFVSVTHTPEELSVVCAQDAVPEGTTVEPGWRCLRVAGKLKLSLVGVIAAMTRVLAEEEISVFVVATFNTDYLLIRESDMESATAALKAAGFV